MIAIYPFQDAFRIRIFANIRLRVAKFKTSHSILSKILK